MGFKRERLEEWFLRVLSPGYGYVCENSGGKATRSGWLTASLLAQHLGLTGGQPQYLAIRPNKTTNWLVLDVDQHRSPHHPDRGEGSLETLLERCRLMGLNRPLQIRSSFSGGIHLWFPLSQPVKTFDAALTMKRALLTPCIESGLDAESYAFPESERLQLSGGVLEVFPNDKARDSDYRAIRMPCTGQGNGLFVEGFGIVEEPAVFRAHWEEAAPYNQLVESRLISHREPDCGPYNWVEECAAGDLKFVPLNWVVPFSRRCASPVVSAVKGEGLLGEPSNKSDVSPKSVEDAKYLLKVGWTGRGQTQQLQLAALMVARTKHAEVDLIADEVCELLVGCPGFYDHCGHVDEILRKERPGRSACARAAFFDPVYEGSWKQVANKKRSEDASVRAAAALRRAEAEGLHWVSVSSAIAGLHQLYRSPHKRWWYEKNNAEYLFRLKALVDKTSF